MIIQGVYLAIFGICIVFTFLSLIAAIVSLSAKMIPRFNHLLPDDAPKTKAPAAPRPADADEAVAIAIAVAHQRSKA